MAFEVQSVIFDKKNWSQKQAEQWLVKHGFRKRFKNKGVDITTNFLRYRQQVPSKYKSYRMKPINNNIQLVLGVT